MLTGYNIHTEAAQKRGVSKTNLLTACLGQAGYGKIMAFLIVDVIITFLMYT